MSNDSERLELLLLKHGANPNRGDGAEFSRLCSLLHVAASNGSLKCVKDLLDAGANPYLSYSNTDVKTPLQIAAELGKRDFVDAVIEGGVSPNYEYNGKPLLFFEIESGTLKSAETLLEVGANPNATYGPMQLTCLQTIVESKREDSEKEVFLSTLLRYGADPNKPNIHKKTALHLAAESGSLRFIRFFLKAGSDTTLVDSESMLPFHLLLCSKNKTVELEGVRLLCTRRSLLRQRTKNGDTAILIAIRNNLNKNIIRFLAERSGETPSSEKGSIDTPSSTTA